MPAVKLYLLGAFQLTVHDQPVTRFRSMRARALLAYLALENVRPMTRAHLVEFLWDHFAPESGRTNLRGTLSSIRHCLQPFQLLHTTYQSIQFDARNDHFWCDALELEQEVLGLPVYDARLTPHNSGTTPLPTFLETFENLDSEPFQAWLQKRRLFYQQLLSQSVRHRQHGGRPGATTTGKTSPVAANTSQPQPEVSRTREAVGPIVELGVPSPSVLPTGWSLIPNMGAFYGRSAELNQLERWVLDEQCRLVTILGMGGQGKTALAARFAQQMTDQSSAHRTPRQSQREFAHVIWSSLVDAPPLAEVLHTWLQTLTGEPDSRLVRSIDQQLDRLAYELCRQRCLLILDNGESIMAAGALAGDYCPGYEEYGRLFQRLCECRHQSCLLLTSREQPREFPLWEVGNQSIQTLRLGGLAVEAGQAMLRELGLSGDTAVMNDLVRRYAGSPLALKLVAVTIQELFFGSMSTFVTQDVVIFDHVRNILDQHFARLSATEHTVLYWLASEPEPLSLTALYDNLAQPLAQRDVLEAVRSLQHRSLLEQVDGRFHLPSIISEYMADRQTLGASEVA